MQEPQNPDIDNQSTVSIPESRCDNYPEYLRDTFGYAYDATDRVSLASRESHHSWLDASADELQSAELDEMNDFVRLGVCRGFLNAGHTDQFVQVTRRLLDTPRDHQAVRYPELPLLVASLLGESERPEDGLDFLQDYDDLAEKEADRREYLLFRGRLLLQSGRPDEANTAFHQACEISDEPETRLDITAVCAQAEADNLAADWLEKAESLAKNRNDSALLVDIDIWREQLSS